MATIFKESAQVKQLVDQLLRGCQEFKHIRHARILSRFRYGTWNSKGKVKLGMAKVLTPFERYETDAELAVIINGDIWENLNERQKEALVYHELCHFEELIDAQGNPKEDDEGRPMFKVIGHDLEEFSAVVKKYGLWMQDTKRFYEASKQGEQLTMQFDEPVKVRKLEATGS